MFASAWSSSMYVLAPACPLTEALRADTRRRTCGNTKPLPKRWSKAVAWLSKVFERKKEIRSDEDQSEGSNLGIRSGSWRHADWRRSHCQNGRNQHKSGASDSCSRGQERGYGRAVGRQLFTAHQGSASRSCEHHFVAHSEAFRGRNESHVR